MLFPIKLSPEDVYLDGVEGAKGQVDIYLPSSCSFTLSPAEGSLSRFDRRGLDTLLKMGCITEVDPIIKTARGLN